MSEATDRPAFYALRSGGWRDCWTLLHPPYTLWHLSYVAIGAALAHALDELNGRPLRTRIPDSALWAIAAVGLAAAVGLGIHGTLEVSPWLWAFVATGAFLVVAYNLELCGGAFHSDLWFALAWGGFPVLTGYFAQTATIRAEAVAVAVACAALSAAQRVLSTPVRRLRRVVRSVDGTVTLSDGSREAIDASTLRAAPEGALRWMSLAIPLLAAGLLLSRLG